MEINTSTVRVIIALLLCCQLTSAEDDVDERLALRAAAAHGHGHAQSTTTPDPRIVQLTAVADEMNRKLNELRTDANALNTQLHNIQHQQISPIGDLGKLQDSQLHNLTRSRTLESRHLDSLDDTVRTREDHINSRLINMETPVAFTTRFTNDTVSNLATGSTTSWQTLKFDYPLYNSPQGVYNKTLGLFTAPSTGTYVFFLSVQRQSPSHDQCLEADIVSGHHVLTSLSACPPGFSSASTLAVTSMKSGQTVRARTRQIDDLFGYLHTSFSGMKIYSR